MDIERYLALDRILPAFKFRDIQATATIHGWVSAHGFTMTDIRDYAITYPYMEQIHNNGYFLSGTVEHSKQVRAFERTLPVDMRRILRKERLRRLENRGIRS